MAPMLAPHAWLLLVLLLLGAAGCEAIAGVDDRRLAAGAADGAGASSSGAGAGGGTGGTAGAACGTGGCDENCLPPRLLVAAEAINAPGQYGELLRFSLHGGGTEECQSFSTAPVEQPFAVGWIPPDLVAVAAWNRVLAYDSEWGEQRLDRAYGVSGSFPADVFPLQDPTASRPAVAVAWAAAPDSEIREMVAFDAVSGKEALTWPLNSGDLPIGLGWAGATACPGKPSHLLLVNKDKGIALREAAPFEGKKQVGEDLESPLSLRTLYALGGTDGRRAAWVGAEPESTGAVHYLTEGGQVSGAAWCTSPVAGCVLKHAVPDPTNTQRTIALCEEPGTTERHVVRLDAGAGGGKQCKHLVNGADYGPERRLARLAVQP
ncbi:MAG: hypothetical protein HY744_11975 [Deltaproteobacteria bacterium]|nr:hypothetical protein [Deltaproteobacteria bacterium]